MQKGAAAMGERTVKARGRLHCNSTPKRTRVWGRWQWVTAAILVQYYTAQHLPIKTYKYRKNTKSNKNEKENTINNNKIIKFQPSSVYIYVSISPSTVAILLSPLLSLSLSQPSLHSSSHSSFFFK